jgi:light-independent protochlorophyllide reductase subunit B
MMGLEEHLIGMFRGDFEFHADAAPSHLGQAAQPRPEATPEPEPAAAAPLVWAPEAEKEVGKIPFFVRGKARRNTERFALAQGLATITVDTLYDAKAHYGR